MNSKIFVSFFFLLLLSSCGKFETHPYAVDIHGATNLNPRMIERIESLTANKDTLRVAFISDSHEWLNDLDDAVDALNKQTDLDFVVHCGDLTDVGTHLEMEWSRDILLKLHAPFVALIGNHDFLGSGTASYRKIFGPIDFSFIAGDIKFVCLNTNALEYDYAAPVPDLSFLAREAVTDTDRFSRTVVVIHAPPYSDQFNDNMAMPFRTAIGELPNLMFVVCAHDHRLVVNEPYNDNLLFYAIPSIDERVFRIFTFTSHSYVEETVVF